MTEQEIGTLLDGIEETRGEWEDDDITAANTTPQKAALEERISQIETWLQELERAIFAVDAMIEAQQEADGPNATEEERLEELREKLETLQDELEETASELQGILDKLYP